MLSLIPKFALWPFARAVAAADWFSGTPKATSSAIPNVPATDVTMGASTRALSWCPISKTKIALVYVAVNAGASKYYLQIVNFVGGKPVYGTPSYLADVSLAASALNPLMRITYTGNDRLIVAIPVIKSTVGNALYSWHTFTLVKVNSDDSFTKLYTSAQQQTGLTQDQLNPGILQLHSPIAGRAWFTRAFVNGQGSNYTYQGISNVGIIVNSDDTLTFGSGINTLNVNSPSGTPSVNAVRKDRNGNAWTYTASGGIAGMWQSYKFLDADTNPFTVGYSFSSEYNPLRNFIPLDGDKGAFLLGANFTVFTFVRDGVNSITSINYGLMNGPTGFDFTGHYIEDVIWLDTKNFLVVAGVGTPPVQVSTQAWNAAETSATMTTDVRLIVGKYDSATNKITLSTNTALLNKSMSKIIFDRMLHQVDSNTVALIGSFDAAGGTTPTHQILMVKPGAPDLTAIIGDQYRFRHMSFLTSDYIDDVKEEFGALVGSSTYVGQKMTTTGAAGSFQLDEQIFGVEDFTIQGRFNATALTYPCVLFGTKNAPSGDATSVWGITLLSATTFAFTFRDTNNVEQSINGSGVSFVAGTDYHIEVGRKAGAVYLFVNGVLYGTGTLATGNPPQTPTSRKLTIGEATTFNGKRWDVSIERGQCLHTAAFAVPALAKYVRPAYDGATSKLIRFQTEFRRDKMINEATNRMINTNGNGTTRASRGRMIFSGQVTAGNRWISHIDAWGAGDFTVECCFQSTAIAPDGQMLMGHWGVGSATLDDNRWYLFLSAARQVYFAISNSAVGSDAAVINTPTVIALGATYKAVVERLNGVVTLYLLDGLTGNLISQASMNNTKPIRGAAPHWVSNQCTGAPQVYGTGKTWDMRIVDKAVYNGAVTLLPVYPAVQVGTYTDSEAAAIVTQATMRRSPRCEKTNNLVRCIGQTLDVANGFIPSSNDADYRAWRLQVPKFAMAGDFTVECRFVNTAAASNNALIMGQWFDAGLPGWALRLANGNKFEFVASNNGTYTSGNLTLLTAPTALVLNQEYYIVIERVSGIATMYIDGVKVNQVAMPTVYNGGCHLGRYSPSGGAGTLGMWLRDIRISKVAQYNGAVPSAPQYKRFATEKPSITMGGVNGSAGTIYGFLENSDYTSGLGYFSIGACTASLFRDTRVTPNVVKRLKGLFMDRGQYTILGWENTDLTPTDDMPAWTNSLIINDVHYWLDQAAKPAGFTTPINPDYNTSNGVCYWQVNPMGVLTENREIAFAFGELTKVFGLDALPEDTAAIGNVTTGSDGSKTFVPGSYLSIGCDPDYVFRNGDFEINFEFAYNAINTVGANGAFTTILSWRTYAAGGQPINYEVGYYHTDGYFYIATSSDVASANLTWVRPLTANQFYKVRLSRTKGNLAFSVDGTLINIQGYNIDIDLDVNAPMLIGRRVGGSSANINWDSSMQLKSLNILRVK